MSVATARTGTNPRTDLVGLVAGAPRLVEVPVLTCLAIDGTEAPDTTAFREAIRALYSLSYTIHFALKRERGIDQRVMPLEGLWWAADGGPFDAYKPDGSRWTLMIGQASEVASEVLDDAKTELARRHPEIDTKGVRLDRVDEGVAAQVLHVGPYSAEAPTIARLHAFIHEAGLVPVGPHHEIYLGDPRRASPERLRTLIRQAVTNASPDQAQGGAP